MSYLKRFDLSGKTVLLTGGAGILGRHFAAGFVEAGASLALVDCDDTVMEVAKQIPGQKSSVRGYVCDVGDPSAVSKTIAQVVKDFGRIDVLHNNAATKGSDVKEFFAPLQEAKLETWNEIMRVNLDGMFLVAQAVAQQMIASKIPGSIIQTASIYGAMAPDQRIYEGSEYLGAQMSSPAVYSASKGGVIALSRHLASELAKHNIRVNTLIPGGVQHQQSPKFIERYSARVPLGRMANAEEMVGAVLFLATDASSYVTGTELFVDGGLHCW